MKLLKYAKITLLIVILAEEISNAMHTVKVEKILKSPFS